jgi:hypothetical protein
MCCGGGLQEATNPLERNEAMAIKGKYWYFKSLHECPVCGRSDTYRERRYTPKPENPQDRCEYVVDYDYCNSL